MSPEDQAALENFVRQNAPKAAPLQAGDAAALEAFIASQHKKPSATMDALKAGASGLAEGALKLPFLLGDVAKLGMNTFAPEFVKKNPDSMKYLGSSAVDEALSALGMNFYKPETEAGKWIGAGAQGVGGGLNGSIMRGVLSKASAAATKAALPAAGLAGAGGGLGAKAGTDLFPDSPQVGGVLGGLAGGLAPSGVGGLMTLLSQNPRYLNFATGSTPNAERMLAQSSAGVTKADFATAKDTLQSLQNAGSTSYTMGDLFKPGSTVGGATAAIRNMPGSAVLQQRLAGRPGDINALIADALDASGPSTMSPMAVSGNLAANANARINGVSSGNGPRVGGLRQVASRPLEKLGELPPVPEGPVMQGIRNLESQAGARGQTDNDISAMKEIALALTDRNNPQPRLRLGPDNTMIQSIEPGPHDSVGKMGLQIADTQMRSPANGALAGQLLDKRALGNAQRAASTELSNLPEPWGPAYSDARIRADYLKEKFLTPAIEGPLGKIGGHPGSVAETPANRMNSIVDGRSPEEIAAIVKQLGKGADLRGDTQTTQEIARALLAQRSNTGVNGDVSVLRGQAGSPMDLNTQALITATGNNAGKFTQKLDAAGLLGEHNRFLGDPNIALELAKSGEKSWLGALARPLYAVRQLAAEGASKHATEMVSELLANPTADRINHLQRMMEVDPELKAAIARAGILTGSAQGIPGATAPNKEQQ